MEARREPALDGLRAVAVLAVVEGHSSMLPGYVGIRGVDLFFVISGFCLSFPALRRLAAGEAFSFDAGRFALNRATRIAPPYLVALALFIWLTCYTPFGFPMVTDPPGRFEWLQDALIVSIGIPTFNQSFWTLGVEARWYLLFPALLKIYARNRIAFAVLIPLLYGAYALVPVCWDLGTLPCFMIGIVAADCYAHGRFRSWIVAPLAAAAIALAWIFGVNFQHGDPLWHLAAFLLVLAGMGPLARPFSWRPLAFIGGASYSIYLVHLPLIMYIREHGVHHFIAGPLVVLAGVIFWRVVEVPALAWRARLASAAKKTRTAPIVRPALVLEAAEA